MDDVDDGPSTPEVLPESERPIPCIPTTSTRKKRWVIVVDDSLLRGTEGPLFWTGPSLREVCCLPGTWVKDIPGKTPSLVRPSDYYPFMLFQVGGDEATTCSPRAIKRDFRALGWVVRESGAQVVFSTLLPVAGVCLRRRHGLQPSWSSSTPMHAKWATNKRSWKPSRC